MAVQSFTAGQTAVVSAIAVTAFGLGLLFGSGDDSKPEQTGSVPQGAGRLAAVTAPAGYPVDGAGQPHAYEAAGTAANDSHWECLRAALGEVRQPPSPLSLAALSGRCVTVTVVSPAARARPAG